MVSKELLDNLNKLGLPLMEPGEGFDANKTLAEVVKNEDVRLWEAFPVLFANANKSGKFKERGVEEYLNNENEMKVWRDLFLMSLALYVAGKKKYVWAQKLKSNLSLKESELFKEYRNHMAHAKDVRVANKNLSVSRLMGLYDDYKTGESVEAQKRRAKYQEYSLEYALSQVFSPKQKELFNKKLSGGKMTKTECEYFSRVVKKKVQALANFDLHRLAQRLMEY